LTTWALSLSGIAPPSVLSFRFFFQTALRATAPDKSKTQGLRFSKALCGESF
jgi:hypothetical protein